MPYRDNTASRMDDDSRLRLDVLSAPVCRNAENDRIDVAKVESLLAAHGYLNLDATDGPTGCAGTRLENATRRFQKDKGLRADGRLAPGGETIMTLAMSKAPEKPKGKLPEYDPEGRLPDGGRIAIRDRKTGKERPPTPEEFEDIRDLLPNEPPGILERALRTISKFPEDMRRQEPMVVDGPTGGGIR